MILALVLLALSGGQVAWAFNEARVIPPRFEQRPDWDERLAYAFGIFDEHGTRIAGGGYSVYLSEFEGQPAYLFKFSAKNADMSESSQCLVDQQTLLPYESGRKVVQGSYVLGQGTRYTDGVIVTRRKVEGGQVVERQLPAGGDFYDYEELVWLVPQLDFSQSSQVQLNVFINLTEMPDAIMVTDQGDTSVNIEGQTYPAHAYSFNINMSTYTLYTVIQDGHAVPARLDMGRNFFVNLDLDPVKVAGTTAPAAPAEPEAQPPPPPAEEEQPPESEETEEGECVEPDDGEEEEPEPSDPGTNPLGPPPPGSRF